MRLVRALILVVAVGVVAPGVVTSALAQDGGDERPADGQERPADGQERPEEGRSAAFESVRGPMRESVPGGRLLVIAYGIVWVALFGYVGMQWRRQAKLSDELGRIEKLLGPPGTSDERRS